MGSAAADKRALQATDLERFAAAILEAVGTPEDLAKVVAVSLVGANLAGHDSHGVLRLPSYVQGVREGRVQPAARAEVEPVAAACARIDGGRGWGQPAAHLAADTVMDLARANGVGLAVIRHCGHIGRLGEYVEKLARAGQMGFMTCNARPAVAPYGGYTRLLGTNPVAWAPPRAKGKPPLVVDFATATIAEGKLRVADAAGSRVPAGAVVDREGRPSEDPSAFYDGGALLTFGGHKGYGLSVMAELMGGVLSGTGASCLAGFEGGNGVTIVAIEVARFVPPADFLAEVEEFCAQLHDAPRAAGFDEIQVPGEPEERSRQRRIKEGLSVPDSIYRSLNELASELGVRGI